MNKFGERLGECDAKGAKPCTKKGIEYLSDSYSPIILDSQLDQACHAALVAAGCGSKVRQLVLPS